MGDHGDEDPKAVRRVRVLAWWFLLGGLLLLVAGGAVVLGVDSPSTQRILLGAVAVPLLVLTVAVGIRTVRRDRCDRREGGAPALREAARRLPFLASGLFVWSWGFGFVLAQTILPRPTLVLAVVLPIPLAFLSWGGLIDVWRLRREMRREEAAAPDGA